MCTIYPGYHGGRLALATGAVCVLLLLGRGDRYSLGITLRIIPNCRYWAIITLLIGAGIGIFCLVAGAILLACGVCPPIPRVPPELIISYSWHSCVSAPFIEETLYRIVLCVPLVAVAGPWSAVLASGALFAGLHFVYGNPAPDNFIAGYFLAWAYLKSGSFVTPVLLHALGNACALAVHVSNWHISS